MLADKPSFRATLLSTRRAMSPAARSGAADAILVTLAELLVTLRPKTTAGYVPFGSEPGGAGLTAVLRPPGGRLLLPVLLPDNDLDWTDGGAPLGVDAIAAADLVIVPALAVDARGVRLGRGGGSYDRALARLPKGVPVIALLFDGELVGALPAEPHDRRVDGVITPSEGFICLPRHEDWT